MGGQAKKGQVKKEEAGGEAGVGVGGEALGEALGGVGGGFRGNDVLGRTAKIPPLLVEATQTKGAKGKARCRASMWIPHYNHRRWRQRRRLRHRPPHRRLLSRGTLREQERDTTRHVPQERIPRLLFMNRNRLSVNLPTVWGREGRGGLLNVNVSSRALVCLKLYCWHYTTS